MDFLSDMSTSRAYQNLDGAKSISRLSRTSSASAGSPRTPSFKHSGSLRTPVDILSRLGFGPARPEIPVSEEFCKQIVDNGFSGAFVQNHLEFDDLVSLLPAGAADVSLLPTDGRRPLSHTQLAYVASTEFPMALDRLGVPEGGRMGLVLPSGPEMAVCLVSCIASIACAPVNAQNTVDEIVAELVSGGATWVIVAGGDTCPASDLKLGLRTALEKGGLKTLELGPCPNTCGLFTLKNPSEPKRVPVTLKGSPPASLGRGSVVPLFEEGREWKGLGRKEVAMVLHTSGTSGKKKVVTYTVENLVIGATLVMSSWELKMEDVGINMMPLFHVGGIVRNLLAPILAGGATLPCRNFDAGQFWDFLEEAGVTWYYASPTMHHMILSEGEGRKGVHHKIRLIGNAAGGLLPSLAEELRERFNDATVLPSYGMTECMPIASPPANYKLQKPGTSGLVVGPELQICDLEGIPIGVGSVGNIAVRGPPLFSGYEGDPEGTASSFFEGGWFNTGDMGYLDKDGYLFITGRSKEVINRGGEIISPFEIEQAIISHPAIKDTIAFSAPHEVLQEVVGVVIVTKPGFPRVDLQELHRFVGDRLHPAKWPVVAVYMDAVPVGAANKVLRVKLAERLSMLSVDDTQSQNFRLFEAICPPKGSPLTVKIPMSPINLKKEIKVVEKALRTAAGEGRMIDVGIAYLRNAAVAYLVPSSDKAWGEHDSKAILELVRGELNAYVRPRNVIILTESKSGPLTLSRLPDGTVDTSTLSTSEEESKDTLTSPADLAVASAWSQILNLPLRDIGREADFFELGGSSLAAGKMVALLRKQLGISIQAGVVFQHRTVGDLGDMITKLLDEDSGKGETRSGGKSGDIESGFEHLFADDEAEVAACRPKSSTSFIAMLVQIIPLAILYPVTRVSLWYLFIFYLSILRKNWAVASTLTKAGEQKYTFSPLLGIPELIIAIAMTKVSADIVQPFIGIIMKWVLIGRYKAGRYPLWGQYYLRWFFVRQILRICQMGMFSWFPGGRTWYYRLLGAKIGRNVLLHDLVKLGEYDLVTIGDGTWVDNSTLLPFCLDRGSMLLKPVTIGKDCVICQKTTISPGTTMPDGTCLPPCSSSYEMVDADPKFRDYCRVGFPAPHWAMQVFIGYPIIFLGFFSYVSPWMSCLFLYVSLPQFLHAVSQEDLIQWFGTPERLPLFLMLKVVRDCVCPISYLWFVISVKRCVIGKFKAGPRDRTQWNLMKFWLMKKLMPGRDLAGVAKLVGPNFGVISFIYRLLGAKVGRHVYWPGSGVYIEEFDLLEIGDDVVFGSRSEIACCDGKTSAPVKLDSGCMVADRCVLLPGVTLGRNATLGSGTLAAKGMMFSPGSTWIGSAKGNATLWDEGKGVDENAPTTTPYARAIFQGKAKNYVPWPMWFHVVFSAFTSVLVSTYHGIPIVMILALTVQIANPWFPEGSHPDDSQRLLTIYGVMLGIGIFAIISTALVALLFIIMAKWIVIGRRREGRYPWDESSYNQRWQIMRRIEGLRSSGMGPKGPLDFLLGSVYLVWYFRALGCRIGKNVCLYPTGGDPMMTEPELVTIEDEAVVDQASLVAHINSRGEFALNRLHVGRGATLRSGSRLLSGATMEEHSMLLEHTLVLSGDVVDADSIWQGWPARMVRGPPKQQSGETGVALYAGH